MRTILRATPDETRANLAASGFTIESERDTTEAALAYGARARAGRNGRKAAAPRRLADPRPTRRGGRRKHRPRAPRAPRRPRRVHLPKGAAVKNPRGGETSATLELFHRCRDRRQEPCNPAARARMCSTPTAQHPPTIAAPASTRRLASARISPCDVRRPGGQRQAVSGDHGSPFRTRPERWDRVSGRVPVAARPTRLVHGHGVDSFCRPAKNRHSSASGTCSSA